MSGIHLGETPDDSCFKVFSGLCFEGFEEVKKENFTYNPFFMYYLLLVSFQDNNGILCISLKWTMEYFVFNYRHLASDIIFNSCVSQRYK